MNDLARFATVPITWVDEIGSTQVELVSRARTGAAPQALATTSQTAGHGRRGREWTCPPGAGLALSVLLRPLRNDAWTWLPLLAGVAVVEALQARGARGLGLKWPNDVLAPSGKLAGLVAERVEGHGSPPAFVLGIGLNLTGDGLPPNAACLAHLGVHDDAGTVGAAVLAALLERVRHWEADTSAVADIYRAQCVTLGHEVRVSLPGGRDVQGRADDVDDDGCLVVTGPAGRQVLSAGDVVHVRPA